MYSVSFGYWDCRENEEGEWEDFFEDSWGEMNQDFPDLESAAVGIFEDAKRLLASTEGDMSIWMLNKYMIYETWRREFTIEFEDCFDLEKIKELLKTKQDQDFN